MDIKYKTLFVLNKTYSLALFQTIIILYTKMRNTRNAA